MQKRQQKREIVNLQISFQIELMLYNLNSQIIKFQKNQNKNKHMSTPKTKHKFTIYRKHTIFQTVLINQFQIISSCIYALLHIIYRIEVVYICYLKKHSFRYFLCLYAIVSVLVLQVIKMTVLMTKTSRFRKSTIIAKYT